MSDDEAVSPTEAVEAATTSTSTPSGPLPIHHIGVAVQSIDDAMRFYGEKLGLAIVDRRVLAERALEVAFIQTGNTLIELLQPLDEQSTVARYIERRGQGLHHICFDTPDIDAHLRELTDKGVDLLDKVARPGAHGPVAFLNPSATSGVLVELIQPEFVVPSHGAS
jgi:methylmalonyl-CoA epimerase